MNRFVWIIVLCAFVSSCGDDAPQEAGGTADAGADAAGDAQASDLWNGETADDRIVRSRDIPVLCEQNAGGSLPDGFEWVDLGQTSGIELLSLNQRIFENLAQGDFGTYDLNFMETYGANGFSFETPVTVVGAEVLFANLEDYPTPVTLYAWPDFGSNGFDFDIWNPYGTYTRCLSVLDNVGWETYVFPEPIELEATRHIFVGYHRDAVQQNEEGVEEFLEPELCFEDYRNEEEPFYSGIRWPDFDEELIYGGSSSPFYTWQVRLAIIRHDDLSEDERLFALDDGLTSSSRVAWGDYDNDGDVDLMTNGPALYRNDGSGNFENVTSEAIPEGTVFSSSGGVWGDYDNDGCLDYFGQGRGDILLHNECDGTFTDVTEDAEIDDTQDDVHCTGEGPEHAPTEASAWLDLDGDGYLDLYLAEYECWNDGDSSNYRDRFFRNRGNGRFEEITDEVGVSTETHAGRGATAGDWDMDGDTDLYVANYRLDPNFFYENRGNGIFHDIAQINGTQGSPVRGAYGHTIGSVFGDIDGDGDFDIINANLAHPRFYDFSDKTGVLINYGRDGFVDEGAERGIQYRETSSNPTLFDADNDGDLDLFITNVYAGRTADFYLNDGDGNFTLSNYESGIILNNGWGSAAADIDNDGDLDLIAYSLFRNQTDNDNHWVQIRAVGVGTNTSAIGAVITVVAGGRELIRSVSAGSGTGCMNGLVQHVGLGAIDDIDRIEVQFPYGDTVVIDEVDVDQRIWIYSDGESGVGFPPPIPLGGSN
jgi:hypothetical protein